MSMIQINMTTGRWSKKQGSERDGADEGIQMLLNANKEAEAVLFFKSIDGLIN